MNPFIDTTLTRLKEESQHFLQWIDFEIEENKQLFIFHNRETGFSPSPIASLAGFLGDVLVIHIGMIRHFKMEQQFFKLCLIQTCEGTKRTMVVFESLIGEHGGYLQLGVFDFFRVSCSLLYHYFG